MSAKRVPFEASANLQRLIGRELIPNDEMAIVELVKNAYDSGAHQVRIFIQPTTAREPGLVRISDDGSGMSEKELTSQFMFAGFSQRPEEVGKSNRIPTGEKGIGRFAADKLGDKLEVFTKKAGTKQGIRLTVLWKDFDDKRKKFHDIKADYQTAAVPGLGQDQGGTVLEISELHGSWDAKRVDSLQASLADLLNPLARPTDFRITLQVAGRQDDAALVVKPVRPDADWMVELTVASGKIHRVVSRKGESDPIDDTKVESPADLEYLRGLKARFLYFDKRPSKTASKGLDAGVRVYRDGFRIEPFGSRQADWLQIAEKRAKRAGHAHIVPTRLFGFVEISRVEHSDLMDTTSRQALLDTPTARNLVTALRSELDAFGELLRIRTEPRWRENVKRRAMEEEQARLHTLGVMSFGLAHELRQPLHTIRSEADNIRTRLGQLGVHDGDIDQAQSAIDRSVVRIDENIALVSEISKGTFSGSAECDVAEVVQNLAAVFRTRYAALGIPLEIVAPKAQKATVNQLAVRTVLINYIQNAFEAVDPERGGKIVVTLSKRHSRHRIEVDDDGTGVPDAIRTSLFKRFTTDKTGGMGVGLFFCKTVVESHGGDVGFSPKTPAGSRFWAEFPDEQ